MKVEIKNNDCINIKTKHNKHNKPYTPKVKVVEVLTFKVEGFCRSCEKLIHKKIKELLK